MIQQSTFEFLKQLAKNNNTPWFHEHRPLYEKAKADFESLVITLMDEMKNFEDLGVISPRECIFRINRDIRFSNDKSPYKTNFAAAIAKGGKKSMHSSYYFHLQPGESFIGGGLYRPDSQSLFKMRHAIAENFAQFKKIIDNKDFQNFFGEIQGEKLKRSPQGFDPSNLAIEYLKMKSFVTMHRFTDKEIIDKNFIQNNAKNFKLIKPFLDFISKAIKS